MSQILTKTKQVSSTNNITPPFLIPDVITHKLRKAFDLSGCSFSPDFYSVLLLNLQEKQPANDQECLNIVAQELAYAELFEVLKHFLIIKDKDNTTLEQCSDTMISSKDVVEEYINKRDWRINANANLDYSNAGLINQIAGKAIANYWLDVVYAKEEGEAHRCADIHIHDLDCLTGYCAGWSLRQLLDEGFNGVVGRVSSRPPKHFNEALGQIGNFLCILQSEWAGAQALSSFDTYLAPYVFRDNPSFNELKKAIRSFIYNLNVPARWGQSPFTNITLDFTVPKDMQNSFPTSNNQHLFKDIDDKELLKRIRDRGISDPENLTYKNFQPEIEKIDIAYYEVMTEGDSKQQPFTFPIPTVNITEDFNWDSPAAKALFENTAKIGNSYFQNFIGSQYIKDKNGKQIPNPEAYAPDAVRSMCCRLQLDFRELLKRGNGLFGSAEMTGSIGVVTINMARLGYRFKGNKKGLYRELSKLLDIAKSTLEKKRVFVQKMYDRNLYPYTKRYLRGLKNHFSTIGVNGMNEMLSNFNGNNSDISSLEGIKFCAEILEFIRDKMKEYQEETGNLYNLEATPAEGTTYRFAKEDKKRYPNIVQAGSGENIYYTNSSQLPAGFTDDPYDALEKQDTLQCKYTGGTVLHLYMNKKLSSGESCKNFVKTVIQNYKLPYVTVTPVFSVCEEHGYLKGEQANCSICGKESIVWTRVMGYQRPVFSFNRGKKGEHRERKHFKIKN
ncbi:MAG: ribonucleoside triphosphate reductase [Rickettsiaceae bacterium]|nr:ribonucleoside triphosphate reductase [Rickettsiaceae bacterium]